MQTSETITALAEAMSKFQGACEAATKNSVNPAFRNKYADLAAIWDAVREPLAACGLSVVQLPAPGEKGELRLHTRLLHKSGEWIQSEIAMPLAKVDPQGYGSALTYARRYALAAMLGVTQEDDDGNAASKPPRQERAANNRGPESAQAPHDDDQHAATWRPSEAQVKRAYAIGAKQGLTIEEINKVTTKYAGADGVSAIVSRDLYDQLTDDEGFLVKAGRTKAAHLAKQAAAEGAAA